MKITEISQGGAYSIKSREAFYGYGIVVAIDKYSVEHWYYDGDGKRQEHRITVRWHGVSLNGRGIMVVNNGLPQRRVVVLEPTKGILYSVSAASVQYPVSDDAMHAWLTEHASQNDVDRVNREYSEREMGLKREVYMSVAQSIGVQIVDPREWLYRNPFEILGRAATAENSVVPQMVLLWMRYLQANGQSPEGVDMEQVAEEYVACLRALRTLPQEREAKVAALASTFQFDPTAPMEVSA